VRSAVDQKVIAEAQAFMEELAAELRKGDRAAVAARYSRRGAWLVRGGEKQFLTYPAIVARYARDGWRPPLAFEWKDLAYEPVGRDAVLVLGKFIWTSPPPRPPGTVTYTGLLIRENGGLRLRLEDEYRPAPAP
jgi:hypothetical protein